MKKPIKRVLTGKGISEIFGGFPKDLKLGKEYTLTPDFEMRTWMVDGKYKAESFDWDKPLPKSIF